MVFIEQIMARTATPSQTFILKADNITIGFDRQLLFKNLSLRLNGGDTLIIKADNGAGKTTLLRGICGLTPLIKGNICIAGIEHNTDTITTNEQIVYIGHHDALAPELKASEAIELWALMRGVAVSKALLGQAFAALGIENITDCPIRILSAGQKRRVAMTRLALVNAMRAGASISSPSISPIAMRLWLLDEPVANMDSTAIAAFINLIEAHNATGGGAIITSHLDLAIKSARIATLESLEGKVLEGGALEGEDE